ncbi:hypothetical protein BDD12DRAFT_983422 [Trichophaea hybrida]|nr:hypothetical protein BDD12DRAFT_983422 [Trichophaea hybrida]
MVRISKQYHLKIVSPVGNVSSSRYERKISTFLDDIFSSSDDDAELPPLEYDAHLAIEEAGCPAVLISFKSPDTSTSFSYAAEKFCKLIFDPASRRYIDALTTRSIIGLSPASESEDFRKHWDKAAIHEVLRNGTDLLNAIEAEYKDPYLPAWVQTLCFAIVAGISFAMDKGLQAVEAVGNAVFGPKGVAIAVKILRKMMSMLGQTSTEEEQSEFSTYYADFKTRIGNVVGALKLATDPHLAIAPQDKHCVDEILWTALYEATQAAAKVVTAKQDIFQAFVKHRQAAAALAVSSGAVAAIGLWSTVSVATTQSIAPVLTWGTAEVAGLLTGTLPVVTTTTIGVASLPFALAVMACGGLGYKAYTQIWKGDKLRKELDFYDTLVHAWKMAHDTQVLLAWVKCSDGLDAEFVDEKTQQRWVEFITKVKEASGKKASSVDFDPEAVRDYLNQQREGLEKWVDDNA